MSARAQTASSPRRAGTDRLSRLVRAIPRLNLAVIGDLSADVLRYLSEARAACDVLVVAINSDASVKALKEDRHPVTPADERAEILAHLSVVDHVTIFEEKDVRRVLRALKPHFHAKGTDYTAATVPERDEVEALGGRVIITGDAKSHSSRDVIREIVSRFRNG